ncbi:Acetyltransferase, GNAT family [Olavius sp. associated proteobacterium Delta 1]|nr:Acetyltransferase, GNAT family [Olavius sp. associated proteobacterium Delta 1]
MEIIRANQAHVTEISRLFDLYRQFYKCESDLDLAKEFIADRINNNESVIFVAIEGNSAKGFIQLYPSFCSVEAIKIFILHDLYVDECGRKSGIGEALMNKATEFAKESGASRIELLTAFDNKAGQHLYEKLGYKKVIEDFQPYSFKL